MFLDRKRFMVVARTSQSKSLLIAIVGGSGAGKSWLAARLHAALGRSARRLSLDDFYRDRSRLSPARRARLNFDHPRAIDWPEFQRVIAALASGQASEAPRYDFKTHCRLPRKRRIPASRVIIAEGLWLLRAAKLRSQFDFSVFMDCPRGLRLRRRLSRDLASRGRTRESVIRQFEDQVDSMHRRFVEPQKRWANVVLSGLCTDAALKQLVTAIKQQLGQKPSRAEILRQSNVLWIGTRSRK